MRLTGYNCLSFKNRPVVLNERRNAFRRWQYFQWPLNELRGVRDHIRRETMLSIAFKEWAQRFQRPFKKVRNAFTRPWNELSGFRGHLRRYAMLSVAFKEWVQCFQGSFKEVRSAFNVPIKIKIKRVEERNGWTGRQNEKLGVISISASQRSLRARTGCACCRAIVTICQKLVCFRSSHKHVKKVRWHFPCACLRFSFCLLLLLLLLLFIIERRRDNSGSIDLQPSMRWIYLYFWKKSEFRSGKCLAFPAESQHA